MGLAAKRSTALEKVPKRETSSRERKGSWISYHLLAKRIGHGFQ
jgi:hypothetical protein